MQNKPSSLLQFLPSPSLSGFILISFHLPPPSSFTPQASQEQRKGPWLTEKGAVRRTSFRLIQERRLKAAMSRALASRKWHRRVVQLWYVPLNSIRQFSRHALPLYLRLTIQRLYSFFPVSKLVFKGKTFNFGTPRQNQKHDYDLGLSPGRLFKFLQRTGFPYCCSGQCILEWAPIPSQFSDSDQMPGDISLLISSDVQDGKYPWM